MQQNKTLTRILLYKELRNSQESDFKLHEFENDEWTIETSFETTIANFYS